MTKTLACALGCPDPILVPPSCDRAWHVACAQRADDERRRQIAREREAARRARRW